MIAAVCSAGPSLLKTWHKGPTDYAHIWAVNAALCVVAADWLSAGDKEIFPIIGNHRPRLGTITMPATADLMKGNHGWSEHTRWVSWHDVPLIVAHTPSINWSMQAALLHAAQLGALHIDLYGCDLAGDLDVAGYGGGDGRNHERWRRETADLATTTTFLAQRGVTITRITA